MQNWDMVYMKTDFSISVSLLTTSWSVNFNETIFILLIINLHLVVVLDNDV